MDFATKNNLIQALQSAKHFKKDFELLQKNFSGSRLAMQLRNANEFTFERDDAQVLNFLFDNGFTEAQIVENRTPKIVEPEDELVRLARLAAEEKEAAEKEAQAKAEAENLASVQGYENKQKAEVSETETELEPLPPADTTEKVSEPIESAKKK